MEHGRVSGTEAGSSQDANAPLKPAVARPNTHLPKQPAALALLNCHWPYPTLKVYSVPFSTVQSSAAGKHTQAAYQ